MSEYYLFFAPIASFEDITCNPSAVSESPSIAVLASSAKDHKYMNLVTAGISDVCMIASNWPQKDCHSITFPLKVGSSILGTLAWTAPAVELALFGSLLGAIPW